MHTLPGNLRFQWSGSNNPAVQRHTAYSCGDSRSIGSQSALRSLLIPLKQRKPFVHFDWIPLPLSTHVTDLMMGFSTRITRTDCGHEIFSLRCEVTYSPTTWRVLKVPLPVFADTVISMSYDFKLTGKKDFSNHPSWRNIDKFRNNLIFVISLNITPYHLT
jgi:hypothetical protein